MKKDVKQNNPIEKLAKTINYKDVEFEVVERPDVLWVGCVDYAKNNTDESDVAETLKRYQALVAVSPIQEKINPAWSAALSISYSCSDKPCGIMFANEFYTHKQDAGYDFLAQPGGLWLRIKNDRHAAQLLLNMDDAQPFEYFAGDQAPLQSAARKNGYRENPEVHLQIEYYCHEEYNTPPATNYAYIPILEA